MYARTKKGSHKKLIAAVALVAIIAVAAVVIVYATQGSSGKASLVGVHVGDTFTYSITGSCSDPVPNSYYPGFYQLNDTDYYKVAVTGVEGTSVTVDTDWVFKNGTDISKQQTIDLSTGSMSDQSGFFGLYPANLKTSQAIYPHVNGTTVPVNQTLTLTYGSSTRQINYYHVGATQYYSQDPTQSTERYLYDQIYFDKLTGILTNFSEIQQYNNPELELEVIYSLTSTNVWSV